MVNICKCKCFHISQYTDYSLQVYKNIFAEPFGAGDGMKYPPENPPLTQFGEPFLVGWIHSRKLLKLVVSLCCFTYSRKISVFLLRECLMKTIQRYF